MEGFQCRTLSNVLLFDKTIIRLVYKWIGVYLSVLESYNLESGLSGSIYIFYSLGFCAESKFLDSEEALLYCLLYLLIVDKQYSKLVTFGQT